MMKQRKKLMAQRYSELKKQSSWAKVDPTKDKHRASSDILNRYVRAIIESEAWPTVSQLKRKPSIA